jgi:hypothetical protein
VAAALLVAAANADARIAERPVRADAAVLLAAPARDPAESSVWFLWQTLFESDIASGTQSLPLELIGEPLSGEADDAQPSSDVSTSNAVE